MTREVTLDEVVAELAARWRFEEPGDEPAAEVIDPETAEFLKFLRRRRVAAFLKFEGSK